MVNVTANRPQALLAQPGTARTPRVAVLLSQRLASAGRGLELEDLRSWMERALPPVDVHIIADPVNQPTEIARLLETSHSERLVLGLGPGEQAVAEIQTQVRKAGLDPLGVVLLTHAALVAPEPVVTERAKLLLAAAVARARAFAGSRPDHLKGGFSVAVSRRALFKLAVREYRAVPAPLPERCVAAQGCRVCVDSCPRDAIRLRDGRIELSKSACESCGLCVSACPSEALTFPGHSLAELDAQITTLLDPTLADLEPRGILFVCRQSAPALDASLERNSRSPAGWLPVSVPCAGAVSPGLMLYCLALGAAEVGVVGCRDQCRVSQGLVVAERVGFCQELLRMIGGEPERVTLCPTGSDDASAWALPAPTDVPPARHLDGSAARDRRYAASAIVHLAEAFGGREDVTLAGAPSPFGIIDLDAGGCTACEACTSVCPTGALAADRQADAVSITFDTAICTACGVCIPRCPEVDRGVLRLERAVDLGRLRAGRTVLYRDQAPRCIGCGAPVAPSGMMARLAELLGDQYAALAPTITRYCLDCRGTPQRPPRGGQRC